MFETDLHAHSLFSACGLHSIIEILTAAKQKGIKAQAITDHGPYLGRKISSPFFERLKEPVNGITLLKGMECNIIDENGNIDTVTDYLPWYDVLLLGLHNFIGTDNSPQYYSRLIIKAIKKNPYIDIIVHPNASRYLTDYNMLTKAALETGIAIELNNSKLRYGKATERETIKLIESCKETGCLVAVSTDAHAINEVGNFDAIGQLLEKTNFPKEKIINRSLESTLSWVEKRKALRQKS